MITDEMKDQFVEQSQRQEQSQQQEGRNNHKDRNEGYVYVYKIQLLSSTHVWHADVL